MSDKKAAVNTREKPDITHVRKSILNHIARACEFGDLKYERGNYLEQGYYEFSRVREYFRACISHIWEALDAMEKLQDYNYGKAVSVKDPESGLPHVSHAAASLMMSIEIAVNCGLLPRDPGPSSTPNGKEQLTFNFGEEKQ